MEISGNLNIFSNSLPASCTAARNRFAVKLSIPPGISHYETIPMTTFDSTKTELSKLLEEVILGKIQLPDRSEFSDR